MIPPKSRVSLPCHAVCPGTVSPGIYSVCENLSQGKRNGPRVSRGAATSSDNNQQESGVILRQLVDVVNYWRRPAIQDVGPSYVTWGAQIGV
jgi:hypothetical protein